MKTLRFVRAFTATSFRRSTVLLLLISSLSSLHAAAPDGLPAADRLPDDKLTLVEAKAFLRDYEAERDQLQAARKTIFARGAKATPEERAKLIEEFHANYGARMKALRAKASRAEELGAKV